MSPPPTLQRWRDGSARLRRHPEFQRSAVEMSGISVGVADWGLVTGIAIIKSGLSLPVALAMSLLVFAGSAQITALQLIVSGAPIGWSGPRPSASTCGP